MHDIFEHDVAVDGPVVNEGERRAGPCALHDREAVPLAVPVVGDDRQQPRQSGIRQNLGLLHPENLIQSDYPSENIIFSGLPEVDRKEKPKVSAGSSGNLRKCGFLIFRPGYACFSTDFVRFSSRCGRSR